MNLRRQLLLVSLLTLVLPWAGCQFVRETESALREGHQQMLSGTAVAIADSLSQFPDDLRHGGDGDFSEDQIYAHLLTNAPLIDGYFDDWPLTLASQRNLRGADGLIYYVIGSNRQHIFLFVNVRDKSITYDTVAAPLAASDHVSLVIADDDSITSRIEFAAEGPGTVSVKRTIGNDTVVDSRILAHWQDSATGYQLEARIPRSLLGSKVGIEIHNAGSGSPIVSRSFARDKPGRFISISPVLQSAAAAHVQADIRLTITDRSGWRLAQVGGRSATSSGNQGSATPSGWQLVIYRALAEAGNAASLAEPDPTGREQQTYIVRALNGEATTSWFRSTDTGRAVVAVAQPVWSGSVQTGALILQKDTNDILSLTNQSLMRLITLTIAATAGAAIGLLGYASWLSLRIRNLSNAADHALDNDEPAIELPSAAATDEIGDLSRSFSSVLRQLASYNEYLKSLASKLSHELRTPLTIVTSSLENLEHEPLSEQSREYTVRARTGARRLQNILNAMSEANRVEQLMENADTEQFDLRQALESTVAAYRDAWPERRFSFTSAPGEATLTGSPELIIQMLDKLVDNAVDFTVANDEISVVLSQSTDRLTIGVENPGPPLPERMRDRLFDSMVSVRSDAGGDNLGLGLNIARLIAKGHGGSIQAENTDNGVRFSVQLPTS